VYATLIVMVHLVGKVGDMIAPSLLSTRPLLLLMMNANDMHLAFTATSTHIVPYFFVAGLRRCMEDPIFFFLGYEYGDAALKWFEARFEGGATLLSNVMPWFEKAAPVCIVVFPNAAVGVLAGTSRMDPARFISLTVVSVLARLVLFRFLGQLAGSLVDAILQKLETYQVWVTAVTVIMGLCSIRAYLNSAAWSPASRL